MAYSARAVTLDKPQWLPEPKSSLQKFSINPLLPPGQIGRYETFEKPPVIWYPQVKQLVDDHVFLKYHILAQQVLAKTDPFTWRARGPFAPHPLNANLRRFCLDVRGPFSDRSLELGLPANRSMPFLSAASHAASLKHRLYHFASTRSNLPAI